MSIAKTISLKWFVARRILQSIPLLLGVIVLTFILMHLAPGDVTIVIVGDASVPPEYLAKLRAELGLDRPILEQLGIYLGRVVSGDLGYSYISRQPVIELIFDRLALTLPLVVVPLVFSSIVGVLLGVIASRKQYSVGDIFASFISLVGFSIPVFWLGQILLIVFGIQLGLFPVSGYVTLRTNLQGIDLYLDILHHLVLPSVALGMVLLALVTRLARASMIESLGQDYILWARSKGVSEMTITLKHALRNALLPVVTVVGYSFGFILTGAVLVETVFAWPGLGRLLVESIFLKDFPVLTGLLIFVSITAILANLLTDIVCAFLDPRIRYR